MPIVGVRRPVTSRGPSNGMDAGAIMSADPRNSSPSSPDDSGRSGPSASSADEELSLSLESMNFQRKLRIPSSVEVEEADDPDLSAVTLNISQPYFVPLNERDDGARSGAGGGLVPSTSANNKKANGHSNNKHESALRPSKGSHEIDSSIEDRDRTEKDRLLKQVIDGHHCSSDSLTEDPDIRRSLTEESFLGIDSSDKRRSSLGIDASERSLGIDTSDKLTSLFDVGGVDLSGRQSFDPNRTGLWNLDSCDEVDSSAEGGSGSGNSGGGNGGNAGDDERFLSELGELAISESYLPADGNGRELPQSNAIEGVSGREHSDAHLVDAITASKPPTYRRTSTTTLKWTNTGKAGLQEGNERKPVT